MLYVLCFMLHDDIRSVQLQRRGRRIANLDCVWVIYIGASARVRATKYEYCLVRIDVPPSGPPRIFPLLRSGFFPAYLARQSPSRSRTSATMKTRSNLCNDYSGTWSRAEFNSTLQQKAYLTLTQVLLCSERTRKITRGEPRCLKCGASFRKCGVG